MNALLAVLARWFDQPDKALHALIGAFVAFGLCAVLVDQLGNVPAALLVTLWAGAALSWGKERYDKAHPAAHTFDGWDAFATLMGVLIGVTAWEGLQRWVIG